MEKPKNRGRRTIINGWSLSGIRALIGTFSSSKDLRSFLQETISQLTKDNGWSSALETLAKIPSPNDTDTRNALAIQIVLYALRTSQSHHLIEAFALENGRRLSAGYYLALHIAAIAMASVGTEQYTNAFTNLHKQEQLVRIAMAALTFAKYGHIQGPAMLRKPAVGKRIKRIAAELTFLTKALVTAVERDRAQRHDGQWQMLLRGVELLSTGMPITGKKAERILRAQAAVPQDATAWSLVPPMTLH